MVFGDRGRGERAVSEAKERPGLMGEKLDHDRGRAGWDRRGFAFPTPGEDDSVIRLDLDEAPGCHL